MIVAVVGGTGFIGQHLVTHLLAESHEVVVVARRPGPAVTRPEPRLVVRHADVADPPALTAALAGADVVVNLTAPDGDAAAWCESLAAAVLAAGARPLVHCSTAVVVGRTDARVVVETTPATPVTPYERRKLDAERRLTGLLAGRAPLAIARPTAVFGRGGENLVSLATALRDGGRLSATARRLLFDNRIMHVVPVGTVARALAFLAVRPPTSGAEVFQISADDDPEQGYRAVEARLADGLGVALPPWPPITLPASALSRMLALRGRSDTNPHRRYSGAALAAAGFTSAEPVGPAVEAFGRWFAHEHPRR